MKAALTACSDPLPMQWQEEIEQLKAWLKQEGHEIVASPYLFGYRESHSNEGHLNICKAQDLTEYFRDPEMDFIFDVSGGDIANSVLPELDYDVIRESRALFCGYSDLTTVLNAVTAKTGRETMNYQIRNLVYDHAEESREYFRKHILRADVSKRDLEYHFLRGNAMQGRVLGGNIRCFLKLAGTPFWPDMAGAILLLESYGGGVTQTATCLHQLDQIGVFHQISGILLGTFSVMEDKGLKPTVEELVQDIAPRSLPIAATRYIGHGTDARAVVIGREYAFD